LAIESDGGLQRNQRPAGNDPAGECFIQASRFSLAKTCIDGDSRGAQLFEAAAGYHRIRVRHRRFDARNARRDQRLRARPGAAGVAARFQIDVKGCPARGITCGFDRYDFGMTDAVVGVETLTYNAPIPHQNRADKWIWAGECYAADCELQRAIHEYGFGRCR
jgi:hypothetical protein